jgi:LysR family transcriptional regulator of gallate degradation
MSLTVSLRHLRAFVAVADHGSVTKASEALFRAQSAVTRSVHELELAFGVDLFERKVSGMLCTTFGNAVSFRARRAMHEFELGADAIRARSKQPRNGPHAGIPLTLFSQRRLVALVNLADSGHMPTVARALGVSQPAVSGAINDLESSFGVALFARTSKGMVVTEEGDLLVFRVRRALAELRHIDADIAALQGTTTGRVVIGALPLGRTLLLPRAISTVLKKHPDLRFATVEGPFDSLAADLRAGDIDFILGALRPPEYARDLIGEALLTARVAVVVRAGHPLTLRGKLTMMDLLDAQWVLANPGTPARALFDQSFAAASLPAPVEAVETSDLAILRGLLLQSDMVTAISPQQLHYEIAAGTLQVLEVDFPNTSRVIGITQRLESHASPGALALMAALHETVSEVG